MVPVPSIIDGLKSATYELSAILLPGVVLVAAAHSLAGAPDPGSPAAWVVWGYCLGLALQGIASRVARTAYVRCLVGGNPSSAPASPAQHRAQSMLAAELGRDVAEAHLLDVVLTRVHPNRHVYDKFLALADTTRALALVAVITAGLVIYDMRCALDTAEPWLMFGGIAVAWAGLVERHRKFAPVAYSALYGKFVALYGRAPTADAPESTDDSRTAS